MNHQELLKAGVHFGHLTRKWHPRMAPYIFMERENIHIIDLNKTIECLKEATSFAERLSKQGKKILFVGTKTQAKSIVQQNALKLRMPYVTERWLGGMLTNFTTMRRAMRKMKSMEKLSREPAYQNLAKKERLMMQRDKTKRELILGGIMELTRPPDALFIVDIKKERIALQEAQRLNIPVIAMVDTNSNPVKVDYPIPSNDDSIKSIEAITYTIAEAISAGAEVRKSIQKEASATTTPTSSESEADPQSEPSAPTSATKRRRVNVSTEPQEQDTKKG